MEKLLESTESSKFSSEKSNNIRNVWFKKRFATNKIITKTFNYANSNQSHKTWWKKIGRNP